MIFSRKEHIGRKDLFERGWCARDSITLLALRTLRENIQPRTSL